jgi:hypothetical protein
LSYKTAITSVGVTGIWGVYLAGVAVGLWRTDGPVVTRLALALLWPLGPAVFMLVVAGLLLAATVAFPAFGALVVAAAGLAWWLL